MSEEPAPEPEQQAVAGLFAGRLTSNVEHHMVLQYRDEDCDTFVPTVLRGTATPGGTVELVGFQYSGAQSPLPGSPYRSAVDADGCWALEVAPEEGVPVPKAGPCTLVLTDQSSGSRLTAYGCWFGDTAECAKVKACKDYGAPADHLYCPPALRVPSSCVVRTPEEYLARGGKPEVAPPAAHRTHTDDTDPIVFTFSDFITAEEAQCIIQTADPVMRRAGVTTDDGKGGRKSDGRTNDLAWLPHNENPTVEAVVQRVADLVGLPAENAEKLQVIHYQQGQRYNRHADAYQPLSDRGRRAMGFSGNRVLTALFYLSPVESGGGTGFANMKFEVKAQLGKLLVFHNCYEGSCQVHPDSVHAGLPVEAGDKWAANLWFHERSMTRPAS